MRIKLLAGAAVALSMASTAALAGTQVGWYVAADAGMHQTATQKVTITEAAVFSRDLDTSVEAVLPEGPIVNVVGSEFSLKSKPGVAAFARAGYQLTPHWRVEAEIGDRLGDIKDIGTGHVNVSTQMVNVLYDFSPESKLHPFVGLGVGKAGIKTTLKGKVTSVNLQGYQTDVVYRVSSKSKGTAWQAIAGVTWALSERLNLDLTYRWLDAGKARYKVTADASYNAPVVTPSCQGEDCEINTASASGSARFASARFASAVEGSPSFAPVPVLETDILSTSSARIRDQSVTVGLRWAFGGGATPPPPVEMTEPVSTGMPEAPPVEKPVVESYGPQAPGARSFTVYFNFNKSNLTDEARQVVNSAAQYALSGTSPSVTVTGHTDTSGSQAYNVRLSEKRANAVAVGLTEAGVDGSAIKLGWTGENDLAVPTKNGVKNSENRRTSIDVTF